MVADENDQQQTSDEVEQGVIVLHGFDNREISSIMRSVRGVLGGRDVIFAKSTPTSLRMKLGELIADVSEDHRYLKDNPPDRQKK